MKKTPVSKIIVALTLTSTLFACAPSLLVPSEPIAVQISSGFQKAGIVGNNEVVIRTSELNASSVYAEITSACVLTGRGYSAKFNTPAKVIVPDYGPASPAISIACNKDDKKFGETVAIHNKSRFARDEQTRNVGTNHGLLGALIAESVAAIASSDKPGDDWSYPDTTVGLGK